MTRTLKRWVSAVFSWLGLGDLSAERSSPPHGWLLPRPAVARARNADRDRAQADAIAKGEARR